MHASASSILCDGCGLPASPEHIAARMERLELVTRFRPIHIRVLFVALDPMPRPQDEFFRPPESRQFFDSLLSALDVSTHAESNAAAAPRHLIHSRAPRKSRRGNKDSESGCSPGRNRSERTERSDRRWANFYGQSGRRGSSSPGGNRSREHTVEQSCRPARPIQSSRQEQTVGRRCAGEPDRQGGTGCCGHDGN
jgi:hypothetical protein